MKETDNRWVEAPVVTTHTGDSGEILVIHSHINPHKAKMILTRAEAGLLLLELYKFINK